MTARLPAGVEAAAICRSVEAGGGFAGILHRGDPDRGAIVLLVTQRGESIAVLERRMAADFSYRWTETSGMELDGGSWASILESRRRSDPDFWLIELDVADAERFVAETIAEG